jgi:hypothetical protein
MDVFLSTSQISPTCVLDLSNNKFSGRIPVHLERLSGFVDVTNNYAVSGELGNCHEKICV